MIKALNYDDDDDDDDKTIGERGSDGHSQLDYEWSQLAELCRLSVHAPLHPFFCLFVPSALCYLYAYSFYDTTANATHNKVHFRPKH